MALIKVKNRYGISECFVMTNSLPYPIAEEAETEVLGYEEREDFLVDYADHFPRFESMSYPKIRMEIRRKVDELARQREDGDDCAVMGDLVANIQSQNFEHHFLKWLKSPR